MKKQTQKLINSICAGLCLVFCLMAQKAGAALAYWDNAGTGTPTSGTWDTTTANWSATSALTASTVSFTSGIAACFCAGGTTAGAITITVPSAVNIAGIFNGSLTPPSCTLVLTNNGGTGSLNLVAGNDALDSGGTVTLSTTIRLPLTGTGTLTVEGSAPDYLNAANTYTGGTLMGYSAVNAVNPFTSTLNFNNGSAFGTGTICLSNCSGCGLAVEGAAAVTVPNTIVATNPANVNLNIVGNVAGLTFSGALKLGPNSLNLGSATAGNLVILAGPISGAGNFSKWNPGILKLSGTNTYTGNTTISNGTLALGPNGSISNTPFLTILPGANGSIFDVSAITAFNLSSNTTLSALATNAAAATYSSVIKGASGGTVNLGSQPICLNFTPSTFTGDTTHPPLVVNNAALTLGANVFYITNNNASQTALGAGIYRLIQVGNGTTGVVNGGPAATVFGGNVAGGAGIGAGYSAYILVSGGNVNLGVGYTASFSGTLNSATVFAGTSNVVLTGTVAGNGNSTFPAQSEKVYVTIDGISQTNTFSDASGDFTINFNSSAIPTNGSPYTVTYTYPGSAILSPVVDSTTTLTVLVPPQLSKGSMSTASGVTTINFTADTNVSASAFSLLSSPTVTPFSSFHPVGNATFSEAVSGSGSFKVTVPTNGSAQYYRIVGNPSN